MINPQYAKQFFANKTVLVTGGAGFIGSHIVELLVGYGAHVRVLDNLRTGLQENLAAVAHAIEFIEGDIRNYQTCLTAADGCTVIYHLAAQVSVPESMEDPRECYDINITGTHNMLEAARQSGSERFVFSSSSAVYGPVDGICTEDMTPNPTSFYGTSKLIGEQLCAAYAQQFGLSTIALRYFNVFGDRQRDDSPYSGVIAQFRKRLAANEPITFYGDGTQTRDFVTVEQVASANVALSTLPNHLTGQAVNIASGTSITLLDLYDRLACDFPEYSGSILFKNARAGDIQHSSASCSKLTTLLKDHAQLEH